MLRKPEGKQLSFYSEIYSRVPEDHVIKQIEKAVVFSFINDLLAGSYCANWRRSVKQPEMIMKLNMLEYMYGLSDERVIEESNYPGSIFEYSIMAPMSRPPAKNNW